jgi:hypothetical protein
VRATPEAFQVYLEEKLEELRNMFVGDERLLFVNAWNEWAEGASGTRSAVRSSLVGGYSQRAHDKIAGVAGGLREDASVMEPSGFSVDVRRSPVCCTGCRRTDALAPRRLPRGASAAQACRTYSGMRSAPIRTICA